MKRNSRYVTATGALATLAALVVGFTAPAGQAARANVTCGQTLTEDTTLTADLTGCPDFGLRISAPVTLDLNGHTISAAGWGVIASGGTIENGSVVGGRGILDDEEVSAGPLAISFVGIVGGGLVLQDAAGAVIDHNAVVNGDGISLDSSNSFRITNNLVMGNGGFCGISVNESGAGLLQNNRVIGNDGGGICTTGSVSTFVDNKVTRNHGDGMSIFDREDTQPDTFQGNTADRNDQLGIFMSNVSIATGEEIPAIDLGGNLARHNGDPRECVALGLDCSGAARAR